MGHSCGKLTFCCLRCQEHQLIWSNTNYIAYFKVSHGFLY